MFDDSVQRAIDRLENFLDTLDTVPYEELRKTAVKIKAEAIAKTPYKTGKLESSISVNVAQHGDRVTMEATASALSPRGYDYAGIQHETTWFNHPIKGQAHYISEPFKHQVDLMKRRIRYRLRRSK